METKRIMKSLGIDYFLTSDRITLDTYLKDNILSILYLSSYIEGNPIGRDVATLLINGRLVRNNNKLDDYFEMTNHADAYLRLLELGKRDITPKDAIDLRKVLFNGILGVYVDGFRRYRNDAGYMVTLPVDKVPEEVNKALATLNSASDSNLDNFLNSADFHLRFSPTHPFEDGVGRTTRLLMNLYLIKNNLRPILLEVKDSSRYNSSLGIFEFSGYKDAFYMTTFCIASKENKEAIIKKLSGLDQTDIGNLAVKSTLSYLLGGLNKKDTGELAAELYYKGLRNGDPSVSVIGLWLLSNENLDNEAISNALNSKSEAIRSVGILSAKGSGNISYLEKIKGFSLNDSSPKVRLLSIAVLAELKKLDTPLISKILDTETDEGVLVRLSKCLISLDPNEGDLNNIRRLMSMDSVSIKRRAYAAYVAHADEESIMNDIIKPIKMLPEVVVDGIISQLAKSKKINADNISKTLSEIAIKDDYIRKQIIAELATGNDFNKNYEYVLEGTLSGTNPDERAYAIYLLGNKRGYSAISEKYDLRMGSHQTKEENIALFLVYSDSLKNSKSNTPADKAASMFFCLDDYKINFVESNEISRLIKEDAFGTCFLLKYKKESEGWRK